jgi:predicted glycoside hydrolase/deacetylase ChbG (UPF0249 family)
MRTARRVIVNADDFGLTLGINRGVAEAHERGVLTSTSLMMSAPAAHDAIKLSRDLPRLGLGLHVVAGNEMSASDWQEELERQLREFQALVGAAPTHLDSHHNVHLHDHALPAFVSAARRLGIPLRGHSPARLISSFYGRWADESHPEQLSAKHLIGLLAQVGPGWTELVCHPGYVDHELQSSYAAERELELETLCDARVRRAIAEQEIELASFAALASEVVP